MPESARLGAQRGFLSRRPFYMPLDHSCAILFLARLFAVDIYKDDGLLLLLLLLLLLPRPSLPAVSYTQRRWAACYFAFSKHASGLVIAKLLNEFSIPQRNCDSPAETRAGKRAGMPQKRHGTRSDAIFMTSYAKHSLCKNPRRIGPLFSIALRVKIISRDQ